MRNTTMEIRIMALGSVSMMRVVDFRKPRARDMIWVTERKGIQKKGCTPSPRLCQVTSTQHLIEKEPAAQVQ